MRAWRRTLGLLEVVVSLTVVGCKGTLPEGGTGSGGVGPGGTSGSGGLAMTGTGGAGSGGVGPGGTSGSGGLAMTGTGGTVGRSTVPDIHRASAAACSAELAEAGVPTSIYDGGFAPGPTALDGGIITCASDSDCPPCQNGQLDRCHDVPQTLHGPWCICDQCNTDHDCGPDAVCVCNQRGWSGAAYENACVAAQCRVDADCGPGGFCSPSLGPCGSIQGYSCHTATDQCWSGTDCTAGTACIYSPATGAWGCGSIMCGG
jgi:hypothetical protein